VADQTIILNDAEGWVLPNWAPKADAAELFDSILIVIVCLRRQVITWGILSRVAARFLCFGCGFTIFL
jgi:hypothetical protein